MLESSNTSKFPCFPPI